METIAIGPALTLTEVLDLAHAQKRAHLHESAAERVDASRRAVEAIIARGDTAPPVYGINTGFGALAETRIEAGDIRALQLNLIRSHACGVGPRLAPAEVRAMMVLRAQVIAQGHSGVRREVLELLLGMLNAGVVPEIPGQGSVGASGDLAPLAHLALALIGEGQAHYEGVTMAAGRALERAGLKPVELRAKEGLALINGTQMMTGVGALALGRALALCRVADICGATSIEALKASVVPFDERLHRVRPHPGQAAVAHNMRRLLADSEIMASHVDCEKVQDPYSLRCMPQVHGASRDALRWVEQSVTREINSVTDNPTVFLSEDGADVLSGGNFHGQPMAIAFDTAAIATAELANISERRVEQLVNPSLSTGLPPFLAGESGLCSGFMIAQVAAAALVSENKGHCHPASVDSIPSSANREDHVSMGSIAATKFARVVDNVEKGLAIELLAAVQGVDARRPLRASPAVEAVHALVRRHVAPYADDRPLHLDFACVGGLIREGQVCRAVEAVVGPLE